MVYPHGQGKGGVGMNQYGHFADERGEGQFFAILFYVDIFYGLFYLKDREHCFTMQVVMNKCFLLNCEKKKLAQIRLVVFEKNAPLILKNDVTEPKARLL